MVRVFVKRACGFLRWVTKVRVLYDSGLSVCVSV
jgi:hypothetical protein